LEMLAAQAVIEADVRPSPPSLSGVPSPTAGRAHRE
jgi:hypothetical protein